MRTVLYIYIYMYVYLSCDKRICIEMHTFYTHSMLYPGRIACNFPTHKSITPRSLGMHIYAQELQLPPTEGRNASIIRILLGGRPSMPFGVSITGNSVKF